MILLLFCLFFTGIFAQDFPKNSNGDIEFTEVVENTLKKGNLFSNAKDWVAKTFGDYKSVLQFEDNENCKLIIKGFSDIDYTAPTVEVDGFVGMTTKEKISYTITIECKDAKYRYTINDIMVHQIVTILGTTVTPVPFPPSDHINKISQYKKDLDYLKALDISKMKKKVLAEHNSKIADAEKSLKQEQYFYEKEYQSLENICSSLKKAMAISNDF